LFFVDASSPCHPCAVLFTLLDFVLWQLLLLQVLLLPLVSLSHLRPVTNVGKSTALVLRATQLLETNAMLTFSLFLQTLESKLTKHKSGSGARLCQSSKHTVLLLLTSLRLAAEPDSQARVGALSLFRIPLCLYLSLFSATPAMSTKGGVKF
jgi:hypothetical protein